MNPTRTAKRSPWVKAPVSNLVRYKPSGIYFARAKVGGKLIRQSLKTDVLSIAKLRLQELFGDFFSVPLRLCGLINWPPRHRGAERVDLNGALLRAPHQIESR